MNLVRAGTRHHHQRIRQNMFAILLIFFAASRPIYAWPTMSQKLALEKDLSEFYHLLQSNRMAKSALAYRELTVFAPTNAAFAQYDGIITEELVLYHLVPMARTLENLKDFLDPLLEEHPPLWINNNGKNTFVNDAKILPNGSDFIVKSRPDMYGKSQVLHIIDEVLSPMSVTTIRPTAYDFLVHPKLWQLIPHTFNSYHKKIIQARLQNLFKIDRVNTYFIPADIYLTQTVLSRIDRETIENSVIPNVAVFTKSALEDFPYPTRGTDRDFFDTVEFLGQHVKISRISKATQRTMNTRTLEILHSNIPVRNGVIHVVKEPLGIFERRLTKFPFLPLSYKIQADPNLNITSYLLDKLNLNELLESDTINSTVFVAADIAWRHLAKSNGFPVSEFSSQLFLDKAKKIMRRHIVLGERYDLQRLLDVSKNLRGSEVILDVEYENIMIKVYEEHGSYYVHWGSKKMKILRPNYECSNGIVHILDSPLILDSDIKDFVPNDDHNNFLHKAWSFVKKFVF